MKQKRISAFLLTLVMTISLLPTVSFTAKAAESENAEKNITLGTAALKGAQQSNVYFGNYQQASLGNTEPTTGTEGVDWIKSTTATQKGYGPYYNIDPIKWRVLSNSDGKVFLLSDQNLDVFQYHTVYESVTWAESTMRSWLNGYDGTSNKQKNNYSKDNFIDSAFSDVEQNAIVKTKVINKTYDGTEGKNPNPSYSTAGGNDTEDQIFLLSIAEATNTAYGFNAVTNNYDGKRVSYNTAYVAGGGKLKSDKMNDSGAANYWWLRSPGYYHNCAAYVEPLGSMDLYGNSVTAKKSYAVRPAFNIDLDSVLFTAPAEKADGGKSETVGLNKPTEYTGMDYKLTIKDIDRKFAVTETEKRAFGGQTVEFTYSNAKIGDNEYISAIITAENSNDVLYYGQVAKASADSGKVMVTIPSDIAEGKYTLKLFNEQINGDKKTDFSSAFFDIALTIGLAGSGTANEPYEIYTLSDLEYFRDKVNSGASHKSANAKLMNDIDMSGIENYVPIGGTPGLYYSKEGDDKGYSGTFDGNGHVIKNLSIKGSSTAKLTYGVFGTISGTVKNLGVDNFKFEVGSEDCRAGAVVGQILSGGSVENCYAANASITATGKVAGGIAGCNYSGNITNCFAYMVTITANRAGGISGDNRGDVDENDRLGTITNCYTDYGNINHSQNNGNKDKCEENILYTDFASGRIAYLLNGGSKDGIWKQNLGENKDAYPNFAGSAVYQTAGCVTYTNTEPSGEKEHDYKSGVCADCGDYTSAGAKLNNGVYEISSLGELMWFAQQINAQEITSHSAILTADITIDNSVIWKPISLPDHCGSTFDGDNHTITFANTREGSSFGLFANYNYSTIKNLYLAGSITCNQSGDTSALVNRAYSTAIQNVISTCIVNNSGSGVTGGLTGYFGGGSATIKNSAVYADISGGGYAGGLIGSIWNGNQTCTVNNSTYVGKITGKTAGALVGYNGNNSSKRCPFTDVYYCEKNGLGYLGATYGGTITATRVESKTADQFENGEVAYLLGTEWGQELKKDAYPLPGGKRVYLYLGVYSNEEPTYKIKDVKSDDNKACATVTAPNSGTYKVVFADYEDGILKSCEIVDAVIKDGECAVKVKSQNNMTLGAGDKIMLWDGNMSPKCETFEVK